MHTCNCTTSFSTPYTACRAVRGLSNYMFHEAQRMAQEGVQRGDDKFDG